MAKSAVQRNPSECYVYEIIVDGITRYIGKGSGPRARLHLRFAKNINVCRSRGEKIRTSDFYNNLAKALRSGAVVTHRIVAGGLLSEDAFRKEAELIATFTHGHLWNETPGGDGFAIEALNDPESFRKKLKAGVAKSWENPERHEKHSALSRARWESPDARQKQSVAVKKAWADPDLRKRHSIKMREQQNTEEAMKDSAGRRLYDGHDRARGRGRLGYRAQCRLLEMRSAAQIYHAPSWLLDADPPKL